MRAILYLKPIWTEEVMTQESASITTISNDQTTADAIQLTLNAINNVVLGKEEQVKLALCSVLGKGHLLIEDLPGMGKTTLAHSLANALGLDYSRIQFTSDLLPADILGSAIYNRDEARFDFQEGPIFNQLVLADEINRATPKTQSALLEAMAEGQVSIEGRTRDLPNPFFVIATQNPSYQLGTYPLPESQLDRFFMRIELGYPSPDVEVMLLSGEDRKETVNAIKPQMTLEQLKTIQSEVEKVTTSDLLRKYIMSLLTESRESGEFGHGLSPRAGIALQRAAQAWALIEGRDYVIPEDVQAVFVAVAGHRLFAGSDTTDGTAETLLHRVKVPL